MKTYIVSSVLGRAPLAFNDLPSAIRAASLLVCEGYRNPYAHITQCEAHIFSYDLDRKSALALHAEATKGGVYEKEVRGYVATYGHGGRTPIAPDRLKEYYIGDMPLCIALALADEQKRDRLLAVTYATLKESTLKTWAAKGVPPYSKNVLTVVLGLLNAFWS